MRSLRICLPLATLCSGIMVSGFWAEPRVADISQARRMTTAIWTDLDRKSTRLNCHGYISYAVFCLKKNQPNAVVFTASLLPSLLHIEHQISDNRISALRDLRNSITLVQLPAVASLLTRYRLFRLQFRFLSTKDDV